MNDAIERLLERLQTGWRPDADQIDRDVPQRRLEDWDFVLAFSCPSAVMSGFDDRSISLSDEILWIDADLTWALFADGFWWLT